MGIIYSVQNKINGKRYIGQCVNSLGRKRGDQIRLARFAERNSIEYPSLLIIDIQKQGAKSFEWSVLFDDVGDEDLDQLEIDTIAVYKTLAPKGYNQSPGGQGKGRRVSDETKKKLREVAKKRPPVSEETRKKNREVATNISAETRKKRSEAQVKVWARRRAEFE